MLNLFLSASLLLMGGVGFFDAALLSQFAIPRDGDEVGGLSAIHISDDGSSLIAVSDGGTLFNGQVTRNGRGEIASIAISETAKLPRGRRENQARVSDAEGIAVAPDGTIYVSFEGFHRVGKFTDINATEQTLPIPREFEALQNNSSLEALAIGPDGALYTLPERSGRYDQAFPVYRFKDGIWDQPFAIPRTGPYLVVGADFGPDGLFYVLERDFTGIGFHTRVRRIDLVGASSETILETGFGVHGNLEGISVWRNPQGKLVMTLIADNNFRSFLTNEIVEYAIDD